MFIVWNWKTPLSLLASCVWNFCEVFAIDLGDCAPKVFGMMICCRGEEQ